MNVLDLFSGIGAFSLGLKRAGMQTTAFCEIDPFCRRVLAKHWPGTPIYDDIRTLTADRLRTDGVAVDLICGGFPCQDISIAGKGAGIAGERSGLWGEYARIIGEVRPRYVVVENVAALLGRGINVVLGDLAALGFDAEWHCIPASAVGAPHRRDRVWIVAYPAWDGGGRPRLGIEHDGCGVARPIEQQTISAQDAVAPDTNGGRWQGERQSQHDDEQSAPGHQLDRLCAPGRREGPHVADADGRGRREQGHEREAANGARRGGQSGDGSSHVADAGLVGRKRGTDASASRGDEGAREAAARGRSTGHDAAAGRNPVAEPRSPRLSIGPRTLREWAHAATTGEGWWAVEPDVGRVVDGPAARVDRRKRLIAIGNSLVPKIPEMIGGAILTWERTQ